MVRLHGQLPPEEYLPSEIASPFRREYVGGCWYGLHGENYDEDGTNDAHNLITGSVLTFLRGTVDRQKWRVMHSQFKLHIPSPPSYFYPDVAVYAADSVQEWFATRPVFLIEVLEPRSVLIDRGIKIYAYTGIPTLQTYLIVEQHERRVYAYQRTENGWDMREFSGEDVIPLPCLDASLSIAQIYEDVR